MAKLSPQVKEIIQIVIFLIVTGAVLYCYWIYPLNRTEEVLGRPEEAQIIIDTLPLPPNDPAAYLEAGLTKIDTFRVDADGLTSLAALFITPELDSNQTALGTVILLHKQAEDRNAMIPLATSLAADGYAVVVYDQRASGLSSGKFHGEGRLEATDLIEMIGWLSLRNKIYQSLTVVGFGVGAEATLIASAEDDRINTVIAFNPYLTTERMLELQKTKHDLFWFPFYKTIMWWWYTTSSGNAAPYRELEQIVPVKAQTLLLMPADQTELEEVLRLAELSGDKLTTAAIPETEAEISQLVAKFLEQHKTDTE